jgi:MFS family permease
LINSFGAFQSYYDLTLGRSPSAISWIGTFQGFLLFLVGILTGPVYDLGYFRELIMAGTFLITFGMMMTSISTEYYQLFLAQGVVVGLGAGCLFVPSVAIASQYFTTKRALAVGLTASGGSLGGVLFPIIFRKLLSRIGFGWATRVLGFIVLGTLLISLALVKPRVKSAPKTRSLLDLSAFTSPSFLVLSAAVFAYLIGLYFPFFYMSSWAEANLGTSPDDAFYLFSILNAGSVFGRVIPGLVADRIGSLNTIIPCTLLTAILGFAWLGVTSYGGLIVYVIFYGFFSGACVSLPPTIIATIVPDLSKIGTWMGMSFAFGGLGLLIGNPIAGAILERQHGDFVAAQCFSAGTVLVGAVLLIVLRLVKFGEGKGWSDKI